MRGREQCADDGNNSNFQVCLPSPFGRQISPESPAGASRGDTALFPHGRQEEDAVRKPLPPGSDGHAHCGATHTVAQTAAVTEAVLRWGLQISCKPSLK